MNSTGRRRGSSAVAGRAPVLIFGCLLACAAWLVAPRAWAADEPMPRPPQLERDVQFWIRVYTQVDTNGGFIHDADNLAVVYDTLHFDPNASSHERQKIVERDEDRIAAALRRIAAANGGPLSDEDQKIRDLWGEEARRLACAMPPTRFASNSARPTAFTKG